MSPSATDTTRVPVTPAQTKVLKAITHLMRKQPWPPTAQELADYMGFSKPTIIDHLVRLAKHGHIIRGRGARQIRIVPPF